MFGSKYFIIVDNNEAGEDIFQKVYKRIRGLVTKKPTKPQAKRWIANELIKKRLGKDKIASKPKGPEVQRKIAQSTWKHCKIPK